VHFEIQFSGHENIRSLHQKTIEITKESSLTPSGDCIVGINASCGCKNIPAEIKKKLQDPETIVKFSIKVENHSFEVQGSGHKDLILTHSDDIVIRKSDFVCPRTLAVHCDKASDDIPREMIQLLQLPTTKGIFCIDIDSKS
jgi:hypothetical protein